MTIYLLEKHNIDYSNFIQMLKKHSITKNYHIELSDKYLKNFPKEKYITVELFNTEMPPSGLADVNISTQHGNEIKCQTLVDYLIRNKIYTLQDV